MPIIQLPYHYNSTPVFQAVRDLPFACWLDSGKPDSHSGRYDIMAAAPTQYWLTNNGITEHYDNQANLLSTSHDNPLTIINQAAEQLKAATDDIQVPYIPFHGGIITSCSYDLGRKDVGIQQQSPIKSQLPELFAGQYPWAIIQDHQQQQSWLCSLADCPQAVLDDIIQRIAQLKSETSSDQTTVSANISNNDFSVGELRSNMSEDSYHEKLKHVDDYIHAGDCYQVNIAQCFSAPYQGDPFAAYIKLRQTMASPFCAYIQLGEQAIMSLSPERFLEIKNNQVLTQPIKGTVARDSDEAIDNHNATSLQQSVKNQAENLMIVDLLRNDLGKNCQPGSIEVPALFALESFPNVHHLVSSVTGTVADNKTAMDVFQGCFPGGSITGAPKKRAMEIIEELENCQRSIYCGSIAYISANGNLDSNITIRTIACDGENLYCWGGGGIVADSNADEEYQESLTKIGAILAVLREFTDY